ncbi:MAG: hypothetical protein EOP10_30050 [Proteobacteria bacterium]|nr:MAG: hypothetical protein EOP10_30050 [Pseudomonadota bacterium]
MEIEEELVESSGQKSEVTVTVEVSPDSVRKTESQRIIGIQALGKGRVSDEFTLSLISEGLSVEQAALKILTKSDEDRGAKLVGLQKADDALRQVNGKPLQTQDDSLESDLCFAENIGLVKLA